MGTKTLDSAKAYQVRLSNNAILNLEEITGYIAFIDHQPIAAIKIGDAIFKTISKIERNPYLYKECALLPTKTKMYREALCMKWYIIYKIIAHEIIILGIIHTSRKPSQRKMLSRIKKQG